MRGLTIALAMVLAGKGAVAQDVVTAVPEVLAQLVRDEGYNAKLGIDGTGDPKIEGRVGRTEYTIFFYGCESGKNCTSVTFSAGYNLADGMADAAVNDWHRRKRFTKVYLDDERDPFLQMDVNLDRGVTAANFRDTFDLWRLLVEDFEEHIDW